MKPDRCKAKERTIPSSKPKLLIKTRAELRSERADLAAFALDYIVSGAGAGRLPTLTPPDREVLMQHLVSGKGEAPNHHPAPVQTRRQWTIGRTKHPP
jgi:hypothetical protein